MKYIHKHAKAKIIVRPYGGLGNRLRCIASAHHFAASYNIPIQIIWHRNYELNCKFQDLFEHRTFVVHEKQSFVGRGQYLRLIESVMSKIATKVHGKTYLVKANQENHPKQLFINHIKRLLAGEFHTLVISGCQDFYSEHSDYGIFRPTAQLRLVIGQIVSDFKKPTYGIHIRRGDHKASIQHSPLYLFEKVIRNMLNKNPNARFYIATDSLEVERHLYDLFGNDTILSRKKSFSRNTPNGVKDALIDMWVLSCTDKIFGSYNSSFSMVSAKIGNKPLEMIVSSSDTQTFSR